jgi:dihydrofolate reductase
MRKIIVSEFMALDGVIEDPMWTFPYWNDEIASFKHAELFGADALLLGRITYDGFAQAWPSRMGTDDYADHINTMKHHVVSTTLQNGAWENSNIISTNIADEITRIKQQQGKDIIVFGSGKLTHFLMENGLVDQFNIIQYPIVIGKGQTLFAGYGKEVKLKLVQTLPFSSGAVGLVYESMKS